jgi:hypothetical protein
MTDEVRPDAGKITAFCRSSAANRWLRRPLEHATRDLPLLKAPEGSILPSQRTGIRGMSGKV